MQTIALFDDFSKGHFGDNPMRPNGYFGGENFHVLPQGGLRIREGTSTLSNTGLSNGTSYMLIPKAGQAAVIIQGTSAFGVPIGGGAPTSFGAVYAVAPTSSTNGWCWYGGGSIHTVYTDKVYYADAAAYGALAGSPGGSQIAQMGTRIFVGGFSGFNNRIQYSDANVAGWTGTNIIDIGAAGDIITMMRRQRNSIIIVTVGNGNLLSRWWRLSGSSPSDFRVDEITPRGAVVPYNDHIMYTAEGYSSRAWFQARTPDQTEGAYGWVDADVANISLTNRPLNSTVTSHTSMNQSLMPAACPVHPWAMMHAAVYTGSAITQRTMLLEGDTAIGQLIWDYSAATVNTSSEFQVIASSAGIGFTIVAGGTGAAKPTLQFWRPILDLDTAPDETDSSGAAVTGIVHTPIFEDRENRYLNVQAVEVDFRWYSSTTAMTCTVESSGLQDAGGTVLGPQSSTSQAFTVSGAPGTIGQRARKTFYIGDAIPGTQAQVKLTACRGITIERIKVLGNPIPGAT